TTVSYSVGGTASAADHAPLSGSVVIPAGQTSAEVSAAVIDDAIVEPTENISITLAGISGGALVTINQAQNTASADIADNDSAVVSIARQTSGSETGPTAGSFLVSLSVPSSTATAVSYQATGTATAGDDYTPLSGTVVIPA